MIICVNSTKRQQGWALWDKIVLNKKIMKQRKIYFNKRHTIARRCNNYNIYTPNCRPSKQMKQNLIELNKKQIIPQ